LLSENHLSDPTVLSKSLMCSQKLCPSGVVDVGKHSCVNGDTNGTTVYASPETYLVTLKNNGGNQNLRSSELCKQGFEIENLEIHFSALYCSWASSVALVCAHPQKTPGSESWAKWSKVTQLSSMALTAVVPLKSLRAPSP